MSPSSRPHDALFKAAFELPNHARDLLTEILPAPLRAAIDWSTLERESGSFIDPALQSRFSDLLFSVQLARAPALVYVLLEHQSAIDRKMPLRMADYLVRVWKRHAKQHGLPLPLLIPITICHARRGWTGPTTLHELVRPPPAAHPQLAPLVPQLSLLIFDLTEVDDTRLRRWALRAFPKLALLLLRDARDPERLALAYERWRDLFLEVLHAEAGADAVAQVLRYIAQVTGEVRFEEFRATIRRQLPQLEDIAMTIAEELHQQGLQQGLQQGRAELLTRLLRLKFGPLTPTHVTRIQTASVEQLDRYSERILIAESIDELFAD